MQKKHRYDFVVAKEKINECYGIPNSRKLECAWTKIPAIAKMLEEYDWVFWSDADSIILNFEVRLEDFLVAGYDIIGCKEKITNEGPTPFTPSSKLNTGQMFYRSCPFTKEVIKGAWNNHHEFTPGSFEQARINKLLRKREDACDHVLIYSGKAFNTSPKYFELGDFMVHMYGYHGERLAKVFNEFRSKYMWILKKEEKNVSW